MCWNAEMAVEFFFFHIRRLAIQENKPFALWVETPDKQQLAYLCT